MLFSKLSTKSTEKDNGNIELVSNIKTGIHDGDSPKMDGTSSATNTQNDQHVVSNNNNNKESQHSVISDIDDEYQISNHQIDELMDVLDEISDYNQSNDNIPKSEPNIDDECKSVQRENDKTNINAEVTAISTPISVNWVISDNANRKTIIYRQSILVSISIIYMLYSVVLLILIFDHFTVSDDYCNSITFDKWNKYILHQNNTYIINPELDINQNMWALSKSNPELLLYDYCDYKVYPFGNDISTLCQCRLLRIHGELLKDNEWKQIYGFGKSYILKHILKHWYMNELFFFSYLGDSSWDIFNWTSDMLTAKRMKIFRLDFVRIDIPDDIGTEYSELMYLSFFYDRIITKTPDSLKNLKELQYLDLDGNALREFQDDWCQLTALEVIDLDSSFDIISIPKCIKNLINLRHLSMTGCISLTYIPLDLFSLPNIQIISLYGHGISLESLMSYNNITTNEEFNEIFNPSTNFKKIYLQSQQPNTLCNGDISSYPISLQEFINTTSACVSHCDDTVTVLGCSPRDWQNGQCDQQCDIPQCNYDGGDCIQLCDFDICTFELLHNDVCDTECNNTDCRYDYGMCIDHTFENGTICNIDMDYNISCQIEWIGDDWCDKSCNVADCNYDNNDCNSCVDRNCIEISQIFQFVAESMNKDEKISLDELCDVFPFLEQSGYFELYNVSDIDCNYLFDEMDLNNDDLISLYEMILITYSIFGIEDYDKAVQLDCSICVNDYY